MAPKKKPVVTATEQQSKIVRLELPLDLHHQFRIAAATAGTNMATLARQIVEDYLSKSKPKGA